VQFPQLQSENFLRISHETGFFPVTYSSFTLKSVLVLNTLLHSIAVDLHSRGR